MMAIAECSIWSVCSLGKLRIRPVDRVNVTCVPSGVNAALAVSSHPLGMRSGSGRLVHALVSG